MRFHGSICAIATPFVASGEVDLPAFERLLDWHLASGTQGMVVGGSTGESASLNDDEFDRLVASAVARLRGRMPVIAGCGAAATHKSLKLCERAAALGADAALVVTPYYVRPTQEGLYRHYSALAEGAGLPVIVYNVPTRTGCDLSPDTVARLAPHPNIAGVKEAVGDPARMDALLALKSEAFAVLSGDDPTAARAMLAGADGVISVAANVCPVAMRRLCDLATGGHADTARATDALLAQAYAFLGVEPNPIPVKALLARMGRMGPGLRLPLVELSAVHHAAANDCVAALTRIEHAIAADRAA